MFKCRERITPGETGFEVNEWKGKRWGDVNLAIRVLVCHPYTVDATSLLTSLAFLWTTKSFTLFKRRTACILRRLQLLRLPLVYLFLQIRFERMHGGASEQEWPHHPIASPG